MYIYFYNYYPNFNLYGSICTYIFIYEPLKIKVTYLSQNIKKTYQTMISNLYLNTMYITHITVKYEISYKTNIVKLSIGFFRISVVVFFVVIYIFKLHKYFFFFFLKLTVPKNLIKKLYYSIFEP